MGSFFGKEPEAQAPTASQSTGGFGALPSDIQEKYRGLLGNVGTVLGNPSEYFAPMGITGGERQAEDLINLYKDPEAYRSQIETYLSPYRDIITDDINKSFEDPYSALKSRASEAGAFGDTRYRGGEADLDEGRLRAIAAATQSQYNTAQGQMQQSIGNLLGFGGLERSVDLQQRSALPQAINMAGGIYSPLLSAQNQTGGTSAWTESGSQGTLGKIGQVAGTAAKIAGLFSDERLKKNIKKIGEQKGLNVYEYEYLWSPQKWVGYMAQEVEKLFPDAVGESMGFKTVNYGEI